MELFLGFPLYQSITDMEHLLEIEQVTGEKIPEEFMGKELSERLNRKREKLLSTFSIKRKDVFTLDVREIPFCLRSNIYFLIPNQELLSPTVTDPVNAAFHNLLRRMLECDPKKRITAYEGCQREFFNMVIPESTVFSNLLVPT